MNAILFFEDIDNVVRHFVQTHLDKALQSKGVNQNLASKFVRYYQSQQNRKPRHVSEVATEAGKWIDSLEGGPEKVVFMTDLAPDKSATPDAGYGLRVLREVAKNVFGVDVQQFLANQDFLVILLSAYPDKVRGLIPVEWPSNANAPRTYEVPPGKSVEDVGQDLTTALENIRSSGPRLVVADRNQHMEFVANLTAEWLRTKR